MVEVEIIHKEEEVFHLFLSDLKKEAKIEFIKFLQTPLKDFLKDFDLEETPIITIIKDKSKPIRELPVIEEIK